MKKKGQSDLSRFMRAALEDLGQMNSVQANKIKKQKEVILRPNVVLHQS
jgi:hypothetical protein